MRKGYLPGDGPNSGGVCCYGLYSRGLYRCGLDSRMRLGNIPYFCGSRDEIDGYLGHTGVLSRNKRYICGGGRCQSDFGGSISNIAKISVITHWHS